MIYKSGYGHLATMLDLAPDVFHVVFGHRDLHRVGRRVEERRVELAAAEVVGAEPRDGLRRDVEARSRVGFRRAFGMNKIPTPQFLAHLLHSIPFCVIHGP